MSLKKYTYYLSSIVRLLTQVEEPLQVARLFLGGVAAQPRWFRLRPHGPEFLLRGKMDLWSIKETWLDRFYERFGVAIRNGWTIIDIGAGIGDYTVFSSYNFPDNQVFAFKPFTGSYALLQENIRRNRLVHVQAFQEAVSGGDGTLTLDLGGGDPLKISSLPGKKPVNQPHAPEVKSSSLASLFERLQIEKCDVLKMDCEGAEYDILFQAPETILERIKAIVMEYHDGVSAYQHSDLVTFLASRGYQVRTQVNFVHADLGYLCAYQKSQSPG
jgi:FkbM family methyltransferase